MAIAGWHLVRLVEEARRDLVGSTLEGTLFDTVSGAILLPLGSRRGKRWLVITVRGAATSFHWSGEKTQIGVDQYVPSERFNRLWRADLVTVELPNPDRLLQLRFECADAQDHPALDLYVGWAGNSGNVWLVDSSDGTVLETLWESKSNRLKSVFQLPTPPGLIDWRGLTLPEFVKARQASPDRPLLDFLEKSLWGIDRALAEHLDSVISRNVTSPDSPSGKWQAFRTLIGELRRAVDPETPVVARARPDGSPIYLPAEGETDAEMFRSLAGAMVHAHSKLGAAARRAGALAKVRAAVERKARLLSKRLGELDRALDGGRQVATIKRHADLLGAQRQAISRGAKVAQIQDWENGGTIAIQLDPALSPQENIEAIYKQVRKMASAAEHARDERPAMSSDLERIERLGKELEDPDILEERIREIASGLEMRTKRVQTARTPQTRRLPYREFQMGKYTVLVGRSSRDNDELTKRIARPGDLFLHADKVGGSHVILRRLGRGDEFPSESIVAAAQIAAYFSKARHSTLVSVIYADVRHVTKPRKAPPGLVRVSNEKSLMVRPLAPTGYHE